MAERKNTSIWIEPAVNTRLRVIAAYTGLTLGDVIKRAISLMDDQGRVIVGKKVGEEA